MTDNGKICYDDLQNFKNETVNTTEMKTKYATFL
jgi:hypothetical protein